MAHLRAKGFRTPELFQIPEMMSIPCKPLTDPFHIDPEWLDHGAPIKGWKGYKKK
jgi:hypothetical protein